MKTLAQNLFRGLTWVMVLNLIVKPLWILGIEVGVQNAVGAEAYGVYFTLFNFAYIFNVFLDLGVTNYNTRHVAIDREQIETHLPGIVVLKLLLFVGYMAITLAVGFCVGYRGRFFWLLALLSFNQFLSSFVLYLRSNFQALLLFRADSVLSVLDRVLMILMCAVLLWQTHAGGGTFRIEWFVLSQTVAYLATAFVALWFLLRRVGRRVFVVRGVVNFAFLRSILKQSLPFALLVLLMASYNRIDPILLTQLSADGAVSAGVYAEAFRLLDAITMLLYLVSVPLLPVFSKLVGRGGDVGEEACSDTDTLRYVCRSTTWLVMLFVIAAAVTLSFLAEPIMMLFYHQAEYQVDRVFGVLIFGLIPIAITYIYGTLLTAAGRLRRLNIFAALTLALNVVINVVCIPLWGVMGSVAASLAAQSFMAVAQIVAAFRLFGFAMGWRDVIKIALYTLFVIALNCACGAVCMHWAWHLALVVLCCSAVFVASARRLKVLNYKH